MIVNVGLNVPQNEAGYIKAFQNQTYRSQDGTYKLLGIDGAKQLWVKAKRLYKDTTGNEIPEITDFTTLWEQSGLSPRDLFDLRNTKEMGGAKRFNAVAWPMQTTSDLVAGFVSNYAAWPDVGSLNSVLMILGFMPETTKRSGISPETFLQYSLPVIEKTIKWSAAAGLPGHDLTYLPRLKATLEGAGFPEPVIGGVLLAAKRGLETAGEAPRLGSVAQYWDGYREDIAETLRQAADEPVKSVWNEEPDNWSKRTVRFYSPPAIIKNIDAGVHPSHPKVTVKTVGTVFEAKDLLYIGGTGHTLRP